MSIWIRKRTGNKWKIVILTILLLTAVSSWWYFLYYHFSKNNTSSEITKVNTLVKEIYILQNNINNTNDKVRQNIIDELDKLESWLKENENNINRINNIKEKNKELRKIVIDLKKKWININININYVNTINYNNIIDDLNNLKNKVVNNEYKRKDVLNKNYNPDNTDTATVNTYFSKSASNNYSKTNEDKNKIHTQKKTVNPLMTENVKQTIKKNIKTVNYIDSLGLSDKQLEILKQAENK